TLAAAEGRVHTIARHVDGLDAREVQAALVTGVLEHDERLAAVIDEHALAAQAIPRETGIGGARGEEEAIHLVDLREVHDGRRLSMLERTETLRWRGLADVYDACHHALDSRLPRWRDGVLRGEAFLGEEAARDGRDERRIESGKTGELDVDLVAHAVPRSGIYSQAMANPRPTDADLRRRLTPEQYNVTQCSATEPPFRNEFWNHHEPGIY